MILNVHWVKHPQTNWQTAEFTPPLPAQSGINKTSLFLDSFLEHSVPHASEGESQHWFYYSHLMHTYVCSNRRQPVWWGDKGSGKPAVDELIWWPNLLMFPWLLNGHNNEERSERHLVSPVIFIIVFDLLVSNGFFRRLLFLIPYTFLLRSDTKYHSHNFISWYTGNVRFHAFIPTIMHRFWDNLFYNICTIWWGCKFAVAGENCHACFSDNNHIAMFNSFSLYFYVWGFYSFWSTLLNRPKSWNDNTCTADVIMDVITGKSGTFF